MSGSYFVVVVVLLTPSPFYLFLFLFVSVILTFTNYVTTRGLIHSSESEEGVREPREEDGTHGKRPSRLVDLGCFIRPRHEPRPPFSTYSMSPVGIPHWSAVLQGEKRLSG